MSRGRHAALVSAVALLLGYAHSGSGAPRTCDGTPYLEVRNRSSRPMRIHGYVDGRQIYLGSAPPGTIPITLERPVERPYAERGRWLAREGRVLRCASVMPG
jgi:hypothetical protein